MNILNIENHDIRERKLRPDDVLGHFPPDQKERTVLWPGTLNYQDTLVKMQAPAPEGLNIKANLESLLQYCANHLQFADLLNSATHSTSSAQTKPGDTFIEHTQKEHVSPIVVTSGWCRKTFEVTYNTAYRDPSALAQRGLLVQVGKGRATRYQLKQSVS